MTVEVRSSNVAASKVAVSLMTVDATTTSLRSGTTSMIWPPSPMAANAGGHPLR